MSNKTEEKQSYNLEQIISFSDKRNKVFIKEHEPLNTHKLIVEEVIADFLLLNALMAYDAKREFLLWKMKKNVLRQLTKLMTNYVNI